MKDSILLNTGGKNKIFIFDAYGRLFKIIDVSCCHIGNRSNTQLNVLSLLMTIAMQERWSAAVHGS